MRFAMVTTFYPPYGFGGDATFVRALSRALVAQGHEVEVAHCMDAYELLAGNTAPLAELDDPGILVHRLKSRFGAISPLVTQQTGMPGLKDASLQRILERDFDVIHFHNISLVGGPGVLRLGSAPCKLYTLHEHWLICPTHIFWKNRSRACEKPECLSCCLRSGVPPQVWRYTGLRDNALRHVDRLIAPSEFTAERHRSAGITQRIDVLPLFSANEGVAEDGPPREPIPSPYFLYVGRVTASKGVAPMVRSIASAKDINLVVVGDGDLRSRLADEYGSCANIRFLGALPQSHLSQLYSGARALILPSLAPETFGLTIVEAAARGVAAVVRSSSGGAPAIVKSSGGGVLYDRDEDLVPALRRLASDPALALELGQRAQAGYQQNYTRARHLEGYMTCIETVLAEKRP